jgi:hypothetical protein
MEHCDAAVGSIKCLIYGLFYFPTPNEINLSNLEELADALCQDS